MGNRIIVRLFLFSSKFLVETQMTEESQIFDQNFIQRLKNMQKGNIKSVDLKK